MVVLENVKGFAVFLIPFEIVEKYLLEDKK